ncbi:MAG: hypothetical protein H6742_07080 [Alphaproteobacteria bacterium]|nr:hypothetical protein [Alphaproteobacteria bacterium]
MSLLLGAVALWAAVALAAALVADLRAGRRSPPLPGDAAGRVLVLRPCAGQEPGLLDRLAAAPRGTLPVHVRLTVATADDPARPVTLAATATLQAAGASADCGVYPPRGPNEKCSQLAGATAHPLPDGGPVVAVVVMDSDLHGADVDLDALVAPILAGEAAAVWAAPTEPGSPRSGLGDRASAAVLAGSLHAFPLLRGIDPHGLVGKCFAVAPVALAAVGGFAGLVDHLGEDMELSARLRAAGHRVEPAPTVVASMASGRSPGQVVARLARWQLVIRAQRPLLLLSYPLLFSPLPWQLLALALAGALGAAPAGVVLVGLACLAARVGVASLARRRSGCPVGPLALLLDVGLAEAVLTLATARALVSRRLAWRGRALRIGPGGRLEREAPPQGATSG